MRRLRPAVGIILTATVLTGCAGTRPDVAVGRPSSTAWAGTGTVPPSLISPGPGVTALDASVSAGSQTVEPGREYDGVYDASADGAAGTVLVVVDSGIISLRADCGGTWGSGQWTGGVLTYQPYVEPPPQTAPYTDHLGVTQTPEPQPPEPTLEERCGAEIAGTMTAVQDVLSAGPTADRIDTGLVLAAPDGRNATLTAVTSADEPAILGRRWELVGYRRSGGAEQTVPEGDGMSFGVPTLEITGTELNATTGCNSFGGLALADGHTLQWLSGGMTGRACADGQDVEQAVNDVFARRDWSTPVPVYSVTDGELTVSTPDIELRYRDAGPARTTG